MKCNRCGREIDGNEDFCPFCSNNLKNNYKDKAIQKEEKQKRKEKRRQNRCQNCGHLLNIDDDFCPNCGKKTYAKESILIIVLILIVPLSIFGVLRGLNLFNKAMNGEYHIPELILASIIIIISVGIPVLIIINTLLSRKK